ncbi:invasion associated locus B family protein [Rhizobium sp. P40RR-XXII]|uniref:invasion associated locus B family protein n=1 Tax=unclassified Rhizobium TaxID=2613769 RepID=UPI0014575C1F|nr:MULTISPECIES: invasion associated locus B family protein [unclassified Rhizobium]NLR88045.1 invasion associated locus B family protein [Rhizobium sp. P28RR-XV]NLS19055.1 invasion associated locus B family protein [Rhizobium sp. P40RR-XXII]
MSPAIRSFSFKTFTSVALLSSALVAFSATAQEQPAPAAASMSSGAGSAPSAAPQTEEQKQAPQARVQKFDDWYYRCIDGKAADGSALTNCEVAQIATVKQGDQDVNILTLAVAKVPAPAATDKKTAKQSPADLVLTTLVPLNMYIPAGLGIDVADKPVVQLAYRNCNQAGCWAQQKLDGKIVAALAEATDGTGHVQMMNGQKVNIKFSLKGLSAALDALQKAASN